MADLLKNRYNASFFEGFYTMLSRVLPGLQTKRLDAAIHASGWEELELKERMRRISTSLRSELPADWKKTVSIVCDLTDLLIAEAKGLELEYMCLPDMVEVYGLDDVEASCKAMEKITQYTSSEFAVRPFIQQDEEGMMRRMLKWSTHEHYGVRRWSSEGCRPRLPWAMALKGLQKDPSPILPILEHLKADPSDFVRRSVANNLNDISKDHPELVLDLASKWIGENSETDAMLKHGCRTLLKAGDPVALNLFGFPPPDYITVRGFTITTPEVPQGADLHFQFTLENSGKDVFNLRLEYAMHYLRANGSHSRKVFKISERELKPGQTLRVERSQSFKAISTRRYYIGDHAVSLVLNGRDVVKQGFLLI